MKLAKLRTKKSLREFGKFLGIAFQIIDDTIDYFSSEENSGKEIGNDFKEGKMSLPLILSYKRSDRREKIPRIYFKKRRIINDDFLWAQQLMKKYNIEEDC